MAVTQFDVNPHFPICTTAEKKATIKRLQRVGYERTHTELSIPTASIAS